jgi:hypothetical protein
MGLRHFNLRKSSEVANWRDTAFSTLLAAGAVQRGGAAGWNGVGPGKRRLYRPLPPRAF